LSGNPIILTCEHAGNLVPDSFSKWFTGKEDVLNSHRGWDPGALEIAQYLADHLKAPLYYQTISRLLIELNRSLHHEHLFSEFSKNFDKESKASLLDLYHNYRNEVVNKIDEFLIVNGHVIHLSIHTFTPVLNGEERKTDIGILFDPAREGEFEFSESLRHNLASLLPQYTVMFNYPYLGTEDGFTTWLRQKFDDKYIGIELEINQKHVNQPELEEIKRGLVDGVGRSWGL
jgi:predicted N-formylglutamate amidohydrolase